MDFCTHMDKGTGLGCLLAALTISCYNAEPSAPTGSGGPGSGTQGPLGMGPALYLDLSGNSRGAGGNLLVLRFDRDITIADPTQLDLRLPTPGNSFGEWSAQLDPEDTTRLQVWLGAEASLRSRGRRGPGPPLIGQPSTLRIPADGLIRDAATGTFSAEDLDMDVFPGLVPAPLESGDLFGAAAALLMDLNGDGAKDLVITGGAPSAGWLRWQALDHGGNPLAPWVLIPLPDEGLALAGGEVQGNGQVDLIVGTLGADLLLTDFPTNASGAIALPGSQGSGALLMADMNRDGLDDLVAGGIAGLWITHFTATGPTPPTLINANAARHLALIDANRDGRLDIVAALDAQTLILLGTCQGGYLFGTNLAHSTAFDLQVADVNCDGIQDVLGAGPAGARVFRGVGDGSFWPAEVISLNPTQALSCVDLDGDSRPEVLLLGALDGDTAFELLTPEGSNWSSAQNGLLAGSALELVAADWDGDGDTDHLALGTEPRLLMSSLGGTFGDWTPESAPLDLGAGPVSAMTSADFDGDGDLDLALAELGTVVLWRNNSGELIEVLEITTGLNRVEDLAFLDIDQDGDLDLFAAGTVSGLRIFLNNDGAYDPAPAGLHPATPPCNSMAFGDLDQDGDLDLVLGTLRGHQDMVLRNLTSSANPGGGGGDTVPPCTWFGFEISQLMSAKMTHKVALADLDGNASLDLFCGHGVNEADAAWLGQGDCTFAEVMISGSSSATYDLILGDLNQDGVVDLLPASENADVMRSGDGGGAFVFMAQIHQPHTTDLAWKDLNGDGVRDLVSTHDFGGLTNVRLGPWNFFTVTPIWSLDGVDMHNLELIDLDGDGGLDLIVTSEIEGVVGRLYRAR